MTRLTSHGSVGAPAEFVQGIRCRKTPTRIDQLRLDEKEGADALQHQVASINRIAGLHSWCRLLAFLVPLRHDLSDLHSEVRMVAKKLAASRPWGPQTK